MEEERKRVLEEFLENPFWKEYYEDAPSDVCKEYIQYEFLYSDNEEYEDEAVEILHGLEDKLGLEDWKHLEKYAGNNPFRGKCRERIKELEAKAEQFNNS